MRQPRETIFTTVDLNNFVLIPESGSVLLAAIGLIALVVVSRRGRSRSV
jgi:hypothetical protein